MVWFQCEDCGDNLKKPKLPNHFRICSASKLSCIDCGQIFGQQTVEAHTQCITEAEKYGPKGQNKALNGTPAKAKNDGKQRPEVDINVGLSERPPWFCSLCNTKATSRQTLLLHAEGKKHKAKARAFHASKQQPKQDQTVSDTVNNSKNEISETKSVEEAKEQHLIKPEAENGSLQTSKKRKLETSGSDGTSLKAGGEASPDLGNGEVIQEGKREPDESKQKIKKPKHIGNDEQRALHSSSGEGTGKIKWKKLITEALKSTPDGVLKLKKLRKLVLKSIKDFGLADDESQITDVLEQKVNSSSKFTVEGKYVHLATKR